MLSGACLGVNPRRWRQEWDSPVRRRRREVTLWVFMIIARGFLFPGMMWMWLDGVYTVGLCVVLSLLLSPVKRIVWLLSLFMCSWNWMEQGRTCQKARSRLLRVSTLAPEQFVGYTFYSRLQIISAVKIEWNDKRWTGNNNLRVSSRTPLFWSLSRSPFNQWWMDKEESSDGNVITGRVLIDTFLRALPTLPMKTLRNDNNYLYCKHFASAETKQALECYLCDSIRAPLRDAIIILHLQLSCLPH